MSLSDKQLDDLATRIATKVADRPCPLGLTHEEAPKLKSWTKFMDTAISTAIKVVVGIIVTAVVGWVAVGFVTNIMAGN